MNKTLIMILVGVVIGVAITVPSTYYLLQNPIQLQSITNEQNQIVVTTVSKNNDEIKQSNGVIINKELAEKLVINMLITKNGTGEINSTSFWIDFGMNNELPKARGLVLSDNTNMHYLDSEVPSFGKVPTQLSIPPYLQKTTNETVTNMISQFKNNPFILTISYDNIPRITNTTLQTITGNVVFDVNGNKIIVLGDGTKIPTDHEWSVGETVTLNKVAHDSVCQLDQIELSNGTILTSGLADILLHPQNHGLMSMSSAQKEWGGWVNQDWQANNGCDKNEFITWELVNKT